MLIFVTGSVALADLLTRGRDQSVFQAVPPFTVASGAATVPGSIWVSSNRSHIGTVGHVEGFGRHVTYHTASENVRETVDEADLEPRLLTHIELQNVIKHIPLQSGRGGMCVLRSSFSRLSYSRVHGGLAPLVFPCSWWHQQAVEQAAGNGEVVRGVLCPRSTRQLSRLHLLATPPQLRVDYVFVQRHRLRLRATTLTTSSQNSYTDLALDSG